MSRSHRTTLEQMALLEPGKPLLFAPDCKRVLEPDALPPTMGAGGA